MADYTITAADVIPGTDAVIDRDYNAGVSISQGQAVYLDDDETWQLTDVDSATAAVRACDGVAVNAAEAGQPLAVQIGGQLAFGAIFTEGVSVHCSDTPGGIGPSTDTASGDDAIILGNPITTSILQLAILDSGATVA